MTTPLTGPGVHDRGGMPTDGGLDRSDHQHQDWELLIEGLSSALKNAGLRSSHESRRAQESIPPDVYPTLLYYERWAIAAETLLIEKGVLTEQEIDARAAEVRARWLEG